MNKWFVFLCLFVLTAAGCTHTTIPKPRGYFRIDLPEKSYVTYQSPCAFTMEIPSYCRIEVMKEAADSCWFNLHFAKNHARLHFTYTAVGHDFEKLMDESYELAFKHEMKASAIDRTPMNRPEDSVYGLIYDIRGEAASQIQFYLTDSTRHFLRASLYFDSKPNSDSIAPVLEFLRKDVLHMCESLNWHEPS